MIPLNGLLATTLFLWVRNSHTTYPDRWPGSQISARSGVSLAVSSLCRAGVYGAGDVSAELP